MLKWLARRLAPHLVVTSPAPAPQDLAALLEVFLVKKIESETKLEQVRSEALVREEQARSEQRLREAQARLDLRERQRAAGKRSANNLQRDARGRLMKTSEQQPCKVCQGRNDITPPDVNRHYAEGHPAVTVSFNGGQS